MSVLYTLIKDIDSCPERSIIPELVLFRGNKKAYRWARVSPEVVLYERNP